MLRTYCLVSNQFPSLILHRPFHCVDSNRVKTIIIFCDELFSEAADKGYFFLYCAMCIVYSIVYCIVPGQDGGCRCWNTLMERSMVAGWTDDPRNLETIADGGATEIFLVKKCQKG